MELVRYRFPAREEKLGCDLLEVYNLLLLFLGTGVLGVIFCSE